MDDRTLRAAGFSGIYLALATLSLADTCRLTVANEDVATALAGCDHPGDDCATIRPGDMS